MIHVDPHFGKLPYGSSSGKIIPGYRYKIYRDTQSCQILSDIPADSPVRHGYFSGIGITINQLIIRISFNVGRYASDYAYIIHTNMLPPMNSLMMELFTIMESSSMMLKY